MRQKASKEVKGLGVKPFGSLPETEDVPLSSDIGPVERVLFDLWESPEPRSSAQTTATSREDRDRA